MAEHGPLDVELVSTEECVMGYANLIIRHLVVTNSTTVIRPSIQQFIRLRLAVMHVTRYHLETRVVSLITRSISTSRDQSL
jgi:hypothetical protein